MAENHKVLDAALRQMAGGMSGHVVHARSELLNILADLEAGLDFVDEDIQFISPDQVLVRLQQIDTHLQKMLSQMSGRLTSGELPRVVLRGLPNAGKSQLFNSLIASQKAIVSPVAGTTRDYLAAICEIEGLRFELIDTAGIEDATDIHGDAENRISQSAQDKSAEQHRAATCTLLCCDLAQPLNE